MHKTTTELSGFFIISMDMPREPGGSKRVLSKYVAGNDFDLYDVPLTRYDRQSHESRQGYLD